MRQGEEPIAGRTVSRFHLVAARLWPVAQNAWPYLLLAVTVWVVRYWHSAQFGLYEDDYTRIPVSMQMSGSELVELTVDNFTRYLYLGRPFHESLIYLFGFLAGRLGGLRALYGLGFGILVFNAILFYLLLKRLAGRQLAVIGGLAFCLYPANTTQAYLTQSFGIQPSLTFFLLACHLYLAGKKALSYISIAASLLCYETTYAVFLAAPLLSTETPGKSKRQEFILHGTILGLMMLPVAILRYWMGERRVSALDFPGILVSPLEHMLVGPVVNLGMFVYRPLEVVIAILSPVVRELSSGMPLIGKLLTAARMDGALGSDLGLRAELVASLVLSFPILWWLISRLPSDPGPDVSIGHEAAAGNEPTAPEYGAERCLARLAVTGLSMLVLSYPLAYIIPAYTLRGRNTRVHFAGVVGASILVACLWAFVRWKRSKRVKASLPNLAMATLLAFLVAHGFMVQRDYSLSWQLQREFWSQVVELASDVTDGTVILVEPSGLRDTWQIAANTWNLPRILNQIYQFPPDWEEVPRAYRLEPGWEEHLLGESGDFVLDAATVTAPPSLYRHVRPADVIFLTSRGDRLARRFEPLVLGGSEYLIRGRPWGAVERERGSLYSLLVGDR